MEDTEDHYGTHVFDVTRGEVAARLVVGVKTECNQSDLGLRES